MYSYDAFCYYIIRVYQTENTSLNFRIRVVMFDVRVYVSDIDHAEDFYDKWYALMPQKRRERADRFKTGDDRKRCIIAFALLYEGVKNLYEDLGMINGADDFSGLPEILEDAEGKPYFAEGKVCFNISHSKERVIVALSPESVGCDVEHERKGAVNIASRFFSDDECRALSSIEDEHERVKYFTKLWTAKESVVKCCGEGIKRISKDLNVADGKMGIEETISPEGIEGIYHIKEYESEGGYSYCVCSTHDRFEDELRHILAKP